MVKTTPLLLALAICAVLPAQTPILNPANGHTYWLTSPGLDVFQARAEAAAAGAHLASVNDAAEDAWLATNFTGRLWIGLSDEVTEGDFLWDNGDPVVYTNWNAGEPNNSGGNENWVERFGNGQWNDQTSSGNGLVAAGIVEWPFPVPPFQVNQANASLDIDGVTTLGTLPAISTKCTTAPTVLNVGSALPLTTPWDVAIQIGTMVPGAAFTAQGQIVNINIGAGLPFWLSSGQQAAIGPTLPWGGAAALAFNAPAVQLSVHAQAYFVDSLNLDGFSLSQASQLDVVSPAGGGTLPLSLGDDTFTPVALSGPPLCGPSTVNFYGTAYTEIYVCSNGRIMFTTGSNNFTATTSSASTEAPSISVWDDLSPNAGGTVVASHNAGLVRVDFNMVPYFGSTTAVTFGMQLDSTSATDDVTIDGLMGIVPGGTNMFLGLSPGFGATDPGQTAFAAGPVLGPPLPTDMVYEFGAAGSIPAAGGLTSITFLYNGSNYDALGL